jgi:hypothetical protein
MAKNVKIGNIYWAAPIARRAPASLRGPDWAASPQPPCFRLLGGFRNWFGFLERRVATQNKRSCWRCGSFGRVKSQPHGLRMRQKHSELQAEAAIDGEGLARRNHIRVR